DALAALACENAVAHDISALSLHGALPICNYQPRGDQPAAIDQLSSGVASGDKHQVLLGVTGSGKTFTMAKLMEQFNRPSLVLAQARKSTRLTSSHGSTRYAACCLTKSCRH